MPTVHTLGHSTRSAEQLLALMVEFDLRCLVDVRRYPASRRHPHFGKEPLETNLAGAGIRYVHESELGGRRRLQPDSPNTAWRSDGFRAYADYMATPEFGAALKRLEDRARERRTAIMCAEAVPWRCHRQLIADALVTRGHDVIHILGPGRVEHHRLNPAARRRADGTLVYPEPVELQGELDL